MKSGDLVKLSGSLVTYYSSLNRHDLAEKAKDMTFLVLDTVYINECDTDSKLVSCLSQTGDDPYTAMFHSEDLVLLQTHYQEKI
jgi:hypothetical protein